ncbi:uncharacterized protein LOC125005549 [Mugil cephalus]|uniref:uncharacterized protein LOC125005549 n=1 Tax=Mugil cephalus TaxID=48193 RepID=UPI001FB815FE|nr:uncharacterized protein LOC125005549 [Mugil cephalus]
MSSTECLRLFLLCFWLLVGDVNCENTQRGYVLRFQSGHPPAGVHIDEKDYKQSSSMLKSSTAGFEKSGLDRRQSSHIYGNQDDHATYSKSSQIPSHYSYPVIPKTQRTLVYMSENKADTYPDAKNIYQGSSDAAFPAGPNRFQPRNYRPRTSTDYSPFQEDKVPVGFRPRNAIYSYSGTAQPNPEPIGSQQRSESRIELSRANAHPLHRQTSSQRAWPVGSTYQSAEVIPNKFNPLKPFDKTTDFTMMGSGSARKADPQTSFLAWSPRVYTSKGIPEARGYAHVQHLRPGFNKAQSHRSSSPDLTKVGFASSERQPNVDYDSKENQYGSFRPRPPDRPPVPVQGKFKPFERLPINLRSNTHSSDNETAPNQTFTSTALPPSLNSSGVASTPGHSVTGELSTESASPMKTEGQDAELPTPEGQSEVLTEGQDTEDQDAELLTRAPTTEGQSEDFAEEDLI